MREHSCRYGFLLTEIELVVVRNGAEGTPHFGYLEVATIQLAAARSAADVDGCRDGRLEHPASVPLTACLALWGLCMMAGDEPQPGHAPWPFPLRRSSPVATFPFSQHSGSILKEH